MKYSHIVFDIDGTMLDSAYADITALQRALSESINIDYKADQLQFALGIPGEEALKQLGIENINATNQLWSKYMKELSHTMRLFEGIEELICELNSRGIKLGIITSKNRGEYNHDFAPFGLSTNFNTVICVDDCAAPKPSPEPMFAYFSKTGAQPDDILYIGDTNYDSECANSAGVDFGLGLWGCNSPMHIRSTYHFKTPQDVLAIL